MDRRLNFKSFVGDSQFPLHQHAFTGAVELLERDLRASNKKDLAMLLGADKQG